jgi:chemosensory pili system protein ChpC
MNHKQAHVRCLLLSSERERILLPAANVAEIVSLVPPRVTEGMPDWFLGELTWREQSVPLVCLDATRGIVREQRLDSISRAKTIILYGLQEAAQLPFYGIRVARPPRPLLITANDLTASKTPDPTDSLRLGLVKIGDVEASIPNLAELENRIKRILL